MSKSSGGWSFGLGSSARNWHRSVVFRRALDKFCADPERIAQSPGRVFAELAYGWGNEAWSATSDYLEACLKHAMEARRPILECGSGLTTIVLGRLAEAIGTTVCSLEHEAHWAARVQRVLDQRRIRAANVVVTPLRSYGDFDWYDIDPTAIPDSFGLVVCDGPPSTTRGEIVMAWFRSCGRGCPRTA